MTSLATVEPIYTIATGAGRSEAGIAELHPPRPLAQQERIERRRAAFAALGGAVRPLLARLGGVPFSTQELTVYDAIYAATPEIGGFWTLANRRFGLLSHQIASYSVALAFDEQDRPRCFVIDAAITVKTEDASPAALAAGIEQARRAGPLRTAARHAFPGFAL
ncbi:MAG TPA: hypothetical protein VKV26_03380 [Dehalococcoidia bacterium]|nr:hypothetical protein [Dehalococcoidia bacterium]